MVGPPRGWKTALTDYAKSILRDAAPGEPLAGDAANFLHYLIRRHPDSAIKVGVGVERFEVRADGWGGRCLWIIRADGSATDFSYRSCITPPTDVAEVAAAGRRAVLPQILEFRERAFVEAGGALTCPFTGEALTPGTCHVDHAPPWTFDAIVKEFVAGVADLASLVEPTRDGSTETRFRSAEIERNFAEFHRKRASLRIVSPSANTGLLRQSAPSPMTIERARGFRMPIGKYGPNPTRDEGLTLAEIGATAEGLRYLHWIVAKDGLSKSIRRAIEFYLEHHGGFGA